MTEGLPDDEGDEVEAIASLLEEPEVEEEGDHEVPEWAIEIFLKCEEEGITVEEFQEAYG